jgi:hypothetical protein
MQEQLKPMYMHSDVWGQKCQQGMQQRQNSFLEKHVILCMYLCIYTHTLFVTLSSTNISPYFSLLCGLHKVSHKFFTLVLVHDVCCLLFILYAF